MATCFCRLPGIAFVTVIAWIPGHAASYLGKASTIPGGAIRTESLVVSLGNSCLMQK